MVAWYNEIDEYAAQWLRNLIAADLIAPGDVDTRSIEDVSPDDLRPYRQCHFFAGIGVWSYALRLAGWSDERAVWTGSCPCQPFSAAGKGAGFADERHLWPAWHYLIRECRPAVVLGEQVASSNAAPWLDLVQDDLEILDYAFGAVPFPAAGVGAPHIRDRLYWVAYADDEGSQGRRRAELRERADQRAVGPRGASGWMADASGERRQQIGRGTSGDENANGSARRNRSSSNSDNQSTSDGTNCGMADDDSLIGGQGGALARGRDQGSDAQPRGGLGGNGSADGTGPVNGFWRSADWLHCRDFKWRPVEPGTFPLAHGAAARVGRLRGYGNAIVAEAAAEFIKAAMSCMP